MEYADLVGKQFKIADDCEFDFVARLFSEAKDILARFYREKHVGVFPVQDENFPVMQFQIAYGEASTILVQLSEEVYVRFWYTELVMKWGSLRFQYRHATLGLPRWYEKQYLRSGLVGVDYIPPDRPDIYAYLDEKNKGGFIYMPGM